MGILSRLCYNISRTTKVQLIRKEEKSMKKIISTVLVCVMLLGCMLVLASCGGPNSDPEKAEANLKEEGYIVVAANGYGLFGIEKSITATNGDDSVQIFYLTDDADVDAAYEYVENLYNEKKEKNEDLNIKIGKNSDMIWFGTPDAIKAAK